MNRVDLYVSTLNSENTKKCYRRDIIAMLDFVDKKEEDKKVYEVVEYANITDKHCDAGYCISNYQYLRSENGTYELRFLFENTNSIPLDKGCFKLEYTTDDYYVFCYEKVDAYNVIENGHFIDEDFYSKYDDYKLVTLTGDELNTYYSDYDKYVLNQE